MNGVALLLIFITFYNIFSQYSVIECRHHRRFKRVSEENQTNATTISGEKQSITESVIEVGNDTKKDNFVREGNVNNTTTIATTITNTSATNPSETNRVNREILRSKKDTIHYPSAFYRNQRKYMNNPGLGFYDTYAAHPYEANRNFRQLSRPVNFWAASYDINVPSMFESMVENNIHHDAIEDLMDLYTSGLNYKNNLNVPFLSKPSDKIIDIEVIPIPAQVNSKFQCPIHSNTDKNQIIDGSIKRCTCDKKKTSTHHSDTLANEKKDHKLHRKISDKRVDDDNDDIEVDNAIDSDMTKNQLIY